MSSLRPSAALAAGLGLLVLLAADGVSAATKHIIPKPIREHLQPTSDDQGLCRRQGMSMGPLVLFMPTTATTVSVYWHRATDRFVQYPGTTACVVWKRL